MSRSQAHQYTASWAWRGRREAWEMWRVIQSPGLELGHQPEGLGLLGYDSPAEDTESQTYLEAISDHFGKRSDRQLMWNWTAFIREESLKSWALSGRATAKSASGLLTGSSQLPSRVQQQNELSVRYGVFMAEWEWEVTEHIFFGEREVCHSVFKGLWSKKIFKERH